MWRKEENERIKSACNRRYRNMYWVSNCIINTKKSKNTEERKKRVKSHNFSGDSVSWKL